MKFTNLLLAAMLLFSLVNCGQNRENSQDQTRQLLEAIEKENIKKINEIIDSGFDINKKINGKLPLEIAAAKSSLVLMHLINKNADLNKDPKAVFLAAVDAHNEEAVNILYRKLDIHKNGIAIEALARAKQKNIKELLTKLIKDPETKDALQALEEEYQKALLELEKKSAKASRDEMARYQRQKEKIEQEKRAFEELFKNITSKKIKTRTVKPNKVDDNDSDDYQTAYDRKNNFKNWDLVTELQYLILDRKLSFFVMINSAGELGISVEHYTNNRLDMGMVGDKSLFIGLDKPHSINDLKNPKNWDLVIDSSKGEPEFRARFQKNS